MKEIFYCYLRQWKLKGKIIEENKWVLNILLNFTIQKLAEGKTNYYKHSAAIFEEMMVANVFISVNGLIKMSSYKNYILYYS